MQRFTRWDTHCASHVPTKDGIESQCTRQPGGIILLDWSLGHLTLQQPIIECILNVTLDKLECSKVPNEYCGFQRHKELCLDGVQKPVGAIRS